MKTIRPASVIALAACLSLTGATALAQDPDGVRKLGATQVRYQGAEIDLVVSYRFAANNLGSEWLFLDVALTGTRAKAVEIKREAIRLRLPDGSEVSLPDQQEFGQVYRELHAMVARADRMAEPLDIYSGRTPEPLAFLRPPGDGVSVLSVWANDRRVFLGRLYFPVPGGVQPGPYELRIDVGELTAQVPFTLEARQR